MNGLIVEFYVLVRTLKNGCSRCFVLLTGASGEKLSKAHGFEICISGETSLKRIHNFLMHNAEWIEGQLDIPPLIGSPNDTSSQPEPQFRLNIDPVPEKIFNPLHEYCHISDCKFDHVSSMDSFILFKHFTQASY